MKSILVCLVGVIILSCFSTSEVTKNVTASFGNLEAELSQIQANIQNQTMQASFFRGREPVKKVFGCTPEKPKPAPPAIVAPPEPTPQPQTPQIEAPKPVQVAPKPVILSVKGEVATSGGRMMLNKVKVGLNKVGLDKVRKGAKVRIFIDYCYYEGDTIDKDGTVSVDIGWHPQTHGKIGVSLITPNIAQHCSVIIPF